MSKKNNWVFSPIFRLKTLFLWQEHPIQNPGTRNYKPFLRTLLQIIAMVKAVIKRPLG